MDKARDDTVSRALQSFFQQRRLHWVTWREQLYPAVIGTIRHAVDVAVGAGVRHAVDVAVGAGARSPPSVTPC